MPSEPEVKRTVAFFDGQNLFHSAKECFGYTYPNYDVKALAKSVCAEQGWDLAQVRFYTGLPDFRRDPGWNHFWTSKLASMGKTGIKVFSRTLKYRVDDVELGNGQVIQVPTKQEKGIDVRISLDVIRLALDEVYDVALIFSQDQDLSEVADEIKAISMRDHRWIHIASAFPSDPTGPNNRGILNTRWIHVKRFQYDACKIQPTTFAGDLHE